MLSLAEILRAMPNIPHSASIMLLLTLSKSVSDTRVVITIFCLGRLDVVSAASFRFRFGFYPHFGFLIRLEGRNIRALELGPLSLSFWTRSRFREQGMLCEICPGISTSSTLGYLTEEQPIPKQYGWVGDIYSISKSHRISVRTCCQWPNLRLWDFHRRNPLSSNFYGLLKLYINVATTYSILIFVRVLQRMIPVECSHECS